MGSKEATGTQSRTERADYQATADPALNEAADRTSEVKLLTYSELYLLWERQQWQTQELDFSQDRIDWHERIPEEERFQRMYGLSPQQVARVFPDVTARDFGIKSMFFLQPVPAVDKVLTPEERRGTPDTGYGKRYVEVVRHLLALRERNIEVHSLLDLFKDEKETIYSDDIHPKRELMDSRGYSLMAARMAHEMASTWGWRMKPQQ